MSAELRKLNPESAALQLRCNQRVNVELARGIKKKLN